MKYFRGFALAGSIMWASCLVAACHSFTPPAPPAPIVSTAGTVIDEKLMWSAEAAYNVPAQAYMAAVKADKLPDGVKAAIKLPLAKAYVALTFARKAYAIGDAKSFAEQAALIATFAGEANNLIPK